MFCSIGVARQQDESEQNFDSSNAKFIPEMDNAVLNEL